eukprot:6731968-Prymnesium_polylepis.1
MTTTASPSHLVPASGSTSAVRNGHASAAREHTKHSWCNLASSLVRSGVPTNALRRYVCVCVT